MIAGSLLVAPAAHAAITNALGVTCTVAADDVRECGSDDPAQHVTLLGRHADRRQRRLPGAAPSGPDGNYPLIIIGHGYGGAKIGFGASGSTDGLRQFTSRGYAVFSMTDRGFHESCGSEPRSPPAARPATTATST